AARDTRPDERLGVTRVVLQAGFTERPDDGPDDRVVVTPLHELVDELDRRVLAPREVPHRDEFDARGVRAALRLRLQPPRPRDPRPPTSTATAERGLSLRCPPPSPGCRRGTGARCP